MTTTVTESGPFERLVRFQIDDERIAEAKKSVARRLSREVKIHGFRPGKAPLPIVEATVGSERVRQEAIDDLVPPVLTDVLNEEEIRPAVTPELSSVDDVEGGVEVEVRVTLWPTIDTPSYKNRRIEVTNPAVTEEDVDTNTRRMLEQFATVEEAEGPVSEGRFVSIDLEAHGAGEEVEEAKAADLLYEVGSGLLIEGIDEYLAGAVAGDEITFEGPLPEGFHERQGEIVTFKVKVNEVKERILPELTDEWVGENTEFDTVEELTEELRRGLGQAKMRASWREYSEKALATLRDQVEVDLPDSLVRAEMDSRLHTFLHRLEEAELTLQEYLEVSGITQDQFVADLRSQAEVGLRNRLVLEAVAEAEGIDVSEEDLDQVLETVASQSEDPTRFRETFRASGQELALASDILRNKAMDAILSNATPVDEDGNPIDLRLTADEVEAEVIDDDQPVVAAEIVEE